MIVYKSRRFAMRGYRYGASGIVDMVGSPLARYATKDMIYDLCVKNHNPVVKSP